MLFNSISYLLFFPVVFAAYWLTPRSARHSILLVASYIFYMSWIPAYGLLIFTMTVVNYCLGLSIDRFRDYARPIFTLGIIANLATLCYYKYANFLIQSIADLLNISQSLVHLQAGSAQLPIVNIILPLGISFFAFEFIHYLSDVYKGDKAIKHPIDFALFAAFFPSQIAGPIKRFQDFIHQLYQERPFRPEMFHAGLALLLQGLFKKVALADNLSPIVNAGFNSAASLGTLDSWLAALSFAGQIYFDFSGYTDMGRGSALMLGFRLPDNFNLPYIATNLSDFWKRWHISLSTWLRDYLYIPLGGNRCSPGRKQFNLMVTMLLGGLWHGAAWHFMIWGGLHGSGLVISHAYDRLVKRSQPLQHFHTTWIGKAASMLLTFLVVLVCWVYFRAETFAQANLVLSHMFSLAPSTLLIGMIRESTIIYALVAYSIYAFFYTPDLTWRPAFADTATSWLRPKLTVRIPVYLGAFLAAIAFSPPTVSAFIYFQF